MAESKLAVSVFIEADLYIYSFKQPKWSLKFIFTPECCIKHCVCYLLSYLLYTVCMYMEIQ